MSKGNAWEFFKAIIIIQIFFGVSVSLIGYALPDPQYLTLAETPHEIDITEIGSDINKSLQNEISLPIAEMGFLMFYTGNILIDIILNSVFAIPEMITLIVGIFTSVFPIDVVISSYLKIFIMLAFSSIYILALIAFIVNLRSGSGVTVA